MDISWHGGTCFALRGADATVWANLETASGLEDAGTVHLFNGRLATAAPAGGGTPFRIDGPGEFEVGPVFVVGVGVQATDKSSGLRHTAYATRFDGVTVCLLGAGAHPPDGAAAADLGDIDVLLVPLGGDGLSPSDVAELVGRLEPSIVVPAPQEGMASKALASFLTEMGASNLEAEALFKARPNQMPEETKVALLSPEAPA